MQASSGEHDILKKLRESSRMSRIQESEYLFNKLPKLAQSISIEATELELEGEGIYDTEGLRIVSILTNDKDIYINYELGKKLGKVKVMGSYVGKLRRELESI